VNAKALRHAKNHMPGLLNMMNEKCYTGNNDDRAGPYTYQVASLFPAGRFDYAENPYCQSGYNCHNVNRYAHSFPS